jgi:hypothetical protein
MWAGRLAGVIGLAAYLAVYLALYVPKVVLPVVLPIAIQNIEATELPPGVKQIAIRALPLWIGEAKLAETLALWLVQALSAYVLLRLLGGRPRSEDALVLAGNYYYVKATVAVVVVVGSAPPAALALPSVLVGSVLLAFIFTRAYGVPLAHSFVASLVPSAVVHVIATLISI